MKVSIYLRVCGYICGLAVLFAMLPIIFAEKRIYLRYFHFICGSDISWRDALRVLLRKRRDNCDHRLFIAKIQLLLRKSRFYCENSIIIANERRRSLPFLTSYAATGWWDSGTCPYCPNRGHRGQEPMSHYRKRERRMTPLSSHFF